LTCLADTLSMGVPCFRRAGTLMSSNSIGSLVISLLSLDKDARETEVRPFGADVEGGMI
jgi:hypothetical protein